MPLNTERCETCRAGTPVLNGDEIEELLKQTPKWTLKGSSIEREFHFSDFREAIDFVNQVADIAESEDHHPDIRISYSKVWLTLSTHKIGGLSRNDFVLASKIDQIV